MNSHSSGSLPTVALMRPVSDALASCTLTHIDRAPIDVARARRQQREYAQVIESLGLEIRWLPALADLPDAVFVEDTLVVLETSIVVTRLGRPTRPVESQTAADAAARLRPILPIVAPGILEGGDVLRVGRTVYVGRSARTNADGARQFEAMARKDGYAVRPIAVHGCLHLKTGCSALPDGTMLVNPAWVDATAIPDAALLAVPPEEPWAANVLVVGETIVMPAEFPLTRALLADRELLVRTSPISEFLKAEAGVTCLSVLA